MESWVDGATVRELHVTPDDVNLFDPARYAQLVVTAVLTDGESIFLTGRGLIEPLDDIRAGNPPTNPDLLDHLTTELIQSGFDTQHLIRMICKSRVYQLSSQPNRWNVDDTVNYSHAIPRRLTAEVIYDSIYQTTGSPITSLFA